MRPLNYYVVWGAAFIAFSAIWLWFMRIFMRISSREYLERRRAGGGPEFSDPKGLIHNLKNLPKVVLVTIQIASIFFIGLGGLIISVCVRKSWLSGTGLVGWFTDSWEPIILGCGSAAGGLVTLLWTVTNWRMQSRHGKD